MRLRPDTFLFTLALGLLTGIGPLATDMYLPSLPDIGRTFGTDPAAVQLTLSLYLLGFSAGQIFYGPVSDKYGRKPVLLAGLGLFIGASAFCASAPSIEMLILARVVQALGASGPIVLARAIVRDLYEGPRAGRELSRMATIMGLVPAIAPTFGGLLHEFAGWRANFVATLLIGLTAAAMVSLALPETIRARNPDPLSLPGVLRGFRVLLAHRAYVAYMGLAMLTFGGLFAFISGSSFVLQDHYGLSELVFGLAFGTCVTGFISGAIIAARLAPRLGLDRLITIGVTCLAVGGLVMLAAVLFGPKHPASVVLPMMAYMFGVAFVMPQAMAGALTPFPDRAGAAASLVGFMQMTFAALVGIAVGHLLQGRAWPLPAAIAILGCGSFLFARVTRKTRREEAARRAAHRR
ncbi:MAG: multidrug effflux MFS transporter [Alphaproteobacteria bacterium]